MQLSLSDRIEALKSLPAQDLTALVRDNAAPEPRKDEGLSTEERSMLWEALTSPELIHRAIQELTSVLRDVDDQLATSRAALEAKHQECLQDRINGKNEWFKAKAAHDAWRAKTLGYKGILDRRLRQVKSIRSMDPRLNRLAAHNPERKKRILHALFQLTRAVIKHRETFEEEELLPDLHDLDLWETLERVEITTDDGRTMSLADWEEEVSSKSGFTPPEEMT